MSKQQVTEKSVVRCVPQLRFPEFREAEGWEIVPLNRLAVRAKQKNRDEKIVRVLTNSAEFGVVDQRDFFDKDIATQGKLEGYCVVEFGSYVYNPRISSTAPVGPISKNKIGMGVMSPLYTVFKFKDEKSDFYEHFFKTKGWHNYMRQASSTGARHDRMAISSDDFMAMPLPVPSLDEQQKIAACLTAIDDLITAQAQKLNALKTHKKGLMQQLFPREGESVPRVRFPEFRGEGEWEVKQFSNFVRLYRGSSPRPIQEFLTKSDDGINWIKIGDTKFANNFILRKVEEKITKKGAEKSRFVVAGELILANSMSYGKTYELAIDGCIYDGWFVLREYESFFNKSFLLHLLNSDFMQRQYESLSAGGIVQNISSEIVYRSILLHTSILEQQRIATCLTSLDDLITAETQKLASLRIHKKGLMQQLFPSVEQVEA